MLLVKLLKANGVHLLILHSKTMVGFGALFILFIKKAVVSSFFQIMLFQPIFSHYFLMAENKSQILESMSK